MRVLVFPEQMAPHPGDVFEYFGELYRATAVPDAEPDQGFHAASNLSGYYRLWPRAYWVTGTKLEPAEADKYRVYLEYDPEWRPPRRWWEVWR